MQDRYQLEQMGSCLMSATVHDVGIATSVVKHLEVRSVCDCMEVGDGRLRSTGASKSLKRVKGGDSNDE